MNTTRSLLLSLILCFVVVSDATARTPTGALTFSGPGAAVLTTTSFSPEVSETVEGGWAFYETYAADADTITVIVGISTVDPSGAALVSVSDARGNAWFELSLTATITGVAIDGDTVTFTSATLSGTGDTPPADLVVDGTVSNLTTVSADAMTIGRLKAVLGRDD